MDIKKLYLNKIIVYLKNKNKNNNIKHFFRMTKIQFQIIIYINKN